MQDIQMTNPLLIASAVSGAVFLLAVLWQRRGRIDVLVRRSYFRYEKGHDNPEGAHWVVTIHNNTNKPVTITHVGWRARPGSCYVPAMVLHLPRRIEPGDAVETWLAEYEMEGRYLPLESRIVSNDVWMQFHSDAGQVAVARRFEVRDTFCRVFKGRLFKPAERSALRSGAINPKQSTP